ATVAELERDYTYDGVQTCAVDRMCGTVCPVQIDTGQLVKRLRREAAAPIPAAGWKAAAQAWGPVTRAGATALTVASAAPGGLVRGVTRAARAVLGDDTVPEYDPALPRGGVNRRSLTGTLGSGDQPPVAVYLPA